MTEKTSVLRETSLDACPDEELVQRVVARDQAAVAELYDRHSRLVYSLVLRILKDRAAAEALLQEVFFCVWMASERYDVARGTPAAWLVGIARNRAIDRLRSNSGRPHAGEPALEFVASRGTDARAAAGEHRAVLRALHSLPCDQRELIEHAFVQGSTQPELAAHFGLPVGIVKTKIRAAMLILRGAPNAGAGRDSDLERAPRPASYILSHPR